MTLCITKLVTNRAQSSVLLLEGCLTWGLDSHPLLNLVCVEEGGHPYTRKIMGTKSKTVVTSCLAGGIQNQCHMTCTVPSLYPSICSAIQHKSY